MKQMKFFLVALMFDGCSNGNVGYFLYEWG